MAIYNGRSYDPDCICQDDYEWLTETGPYANSRVAIIRRGLNKRRDVIITDRKQLSRSLLQISRQASSSVEVAALVAQIGTLTQQLCTLTFRLSLLDAYPHD